MADLVRLRHERTHSVVMLDRPERHNSLVPELLEDLIEVLDAASSPPMPQCLVLAAEGRTFSTGGDVAGFADADDLPTYAGRTVGLLNQVMLAMIDVPVPIVAAVHGMVTGGSLGLVLASDLVLVGPNASFTPWYREVGFSPDGGWTAILPRLIGYQRVSEILLTNHTITPEEAVELGIATRLVTQGEVLAEAERMAGVVASGIPGSTHRTKRLLRHDRAEIATALDRERVEFIEQVTTSEAAAGMTRFLGR